MDGSSRSGIAALQAGTPSVLSMDTERQPVASSRTTLYRWGALLLVGIMATTVFGPIALMVLSIVAGGAAIWRAPGRPVGHGPFSSSSVDCS